MSRTQWLRTLVQLKTRRLDQVCEALSEAQAAVSAAKLASEQCQTEEAQVGEVERLASERLTFTTGAGGFHASDVVTLLMLLKDAELRSADAARKTRQAEAEVEAARKEARLRQAALQRAQQQLQTLRQQLRETLAQQERAQEDEQDEEAEETAVARLLERRCATARHTAPGHTAAGSR